MIIETTNSALLLLAIVSLACLTIAQDKTDNYYQEIESWHTQRIERLRQPDSWLSLAGLFWLEKGDNTFGSDSTNDIIFPGESTPAFMGTFTLINDTVWITTRYDISIHYQDLKITGRIQLKDDSQGTPIPITWGSLSWFIIKRGDQYGVRLKDSNHPRLKAFHGIDRFPVNPNYRIEATLIPYDPPKLIPIANVIGQVSDSPCPGALEFSIDGQSCRLDPLAENGDEYYFLIFADKTSGNETYGAGRYLSVPVADKHDKTIIDFNKATNPPCAFSDYATCPLPPMQNFLPVAIPAGEKKFGTH